VLLGYRAVRARRIQQHMRFMLSAVALSALFLVSFVLRYVRYGPSEFHGTGPVRWFYMAILVSHEALAPITIPLVIGAMLLGLMRRFSVHRELARLTLPIWLYVSVTGLIVFFLLYVSPGRP
jgi:putative membrane protein